MAFHATLGVRYVHAPDHFLTAYDRRRLLALFWPSLKLISTQLGFLLALAFIEEKTTHIGWVSILYGVAHDHVISAEQRVCHRLTPWYSVAASSRTVLLTQNTTRDYLLPS